MAAAAQRWALGGVGKMGHAIQGIVRRTDAPVPDFLPRCVSLVPLPQGFSLIPLSDELYEKLASLYRSERADEHSVFWRLSGSVLAFLRELSSDSSLAYIETDYFGGAGDQAAAAWSNGDLLTQPLRSEHSVINIALRAIGVQAQESRDEFEALGLQHFRSMDDLSNR